MRILKIIVSIVPLCVFLSGCGDGYPTTSNDAFAVANSEEGFRCQTELRRDGVIRKNQGFAIHTGSDKTSAELNKGESGTYRMTIEEFKAKCATYGIKP